MLFKKKAIGTAEGSQTTASLTTGQPSRDGADLSREATIWNSKDNQAGELETNRPLFKKKNLFPAAEAGDNQSQEQPAETAPKQEPVQDRHSDDGEDFQEETSAEAEQEERSTPSDNGGSEDRFALTVIEPSVATPIDIESEQGSAEWHGVPPETFIRDAAPLPDGYFHDEEGSLHAVNKKGVPFKITHRTPIVPISRMRSHRGDGWGLELRHIDADGRIQTSVFSMSAIVAGKKNQIIGALVDRGLVVVPGEAESLMTFLQECRPERRVTVANKVGWLGDGFDAFVLTTEVVGDIGGEQVLFQPEKNSPTVTSMHASGSLADWQNSIALMVREFPLVVFALAAGFLGPLLKVLGLDGGGINFFGASSRGKTTLLQVAASIWGRGSDPGRDSRSYVQRWLQTSNSLEAIAACHSDTLICLDELGTYSGDLGATIYMLSGGSGKSTLNSHRQIVQAREWNGLILSTGERTVRDVIEETGKSARAGQLTRMFDIPASDVITVADGCDSADLVNDLKTLAGRFYGVAGPSLVKKLIELLNQNHDQVIEELRADFEATAKELTPPNATPEQGRAIRRIAAIDVAGRLAVQLGVLPYDAQDIRLSVQNVLERYVSYSPNIPDSQRGMVRLQSYLISNHTAFPNISDANARVANAKGFSNGKGLILMTDEQLSAASGVGLSGVKDLAKILNEQGFLVTNEVGRLKSKHRVKSAGDRHLRFFTIKGSLLERDFSGDETAASSRVTIDEPNQEQESPADDEAVTDSEDTSHHEEDNLDRDYDDQDEDEEDLPADSFEGSAHETSSIFNNRKRIGLISPSNRGPEPAIEFSGSTDDEENIYIEDV